MIKEIKVQASDTTVLSKEQMFVTKEKILLLLTIKYSLCRL